MQGKQVYSPNPKHRQSSLLAIIITLLCFTAVTKSFAQNAGAGSGFAVDGALYSGIQKFPTQILDDTDDWFLGDNGLGVIEETDSASIRTLLLGGGNPVFEARMSQLQNSVVDGQIWIDAVYARDHFGGTGFTDPTSFTQASKNGQDPASWHVGPANVLGKNDIIDVAGHMRRDGGSLEEGNL